MQDMTEASKAAAHLQVRSGGAARDVTGFRRMICRVVQGACIWFSFGSHGNFIWFSQGFL